MSVGLLYAWVAAVASVTVAYWIAGPIWIERHSLRYRMSGKMHRCSGAVGEITLLTFAAAMLVGIDLASPESSLDDLFAIWPWQLSLAFLFILPFIWVHGVRTGLAAPRGQRKRLVLTYLIYSVFSTIFFYGGVLLMALLVRQYVLDYQNVQALTASALAPLSGDFADSDAVQRALEFSYLDAQTLLSRVEESMSPTFVFAAGIFAINLALRLTPLRSLYMKNAVLMTHLMTMLAIVAILVAGGWAYVGNYAAFIDTYLERLQSIRDTVAERGLDHFDRYTDIVVNMTNQKTLVGFITRLSNEWGGLAAILGIAQWGAQQFSRPEAEASSGDHQAEAEAAS
ncbi:MAG: hypothetical protein KF779_15650 [Hyphomonadaceae bacterium]|nr:hypothetical protein [Hyphomonadaceae bacterium]